MPERNQTLSPGRDGPWWATLALDVLMFLLGVLVGLLLVASICAAAPPDVVQTTENPPRVFSRG